MEVLNEEAVWGAEAVEPGAPRPVSVEAPVWEVLVVEDRVEVKVEEQMVEEAALAGRS